MPAPDHLLPLLNQLGDGATVEMAQRVDQMLADARAQVAVAVAPQEPTPTAIPTAVFHVDTVEELLGQLVGACSSTRFWDLLPTNYPYAAGTFQDQAAAALVDAAAAEYHRLMPAAVPPQRWLYVDPDDSEGRDPRRDLEMALLKLKNLAGLAARMRDRWSEATDDVQRNDLWRPLMEYVEQIETWLEDQPVPTISDLIEASSLGSPDAVAARNRVTAEEAAAVIARAAALADEDTQDAAGDSPNDIQWDDDPEQPAAPAAGPTNAQVRDWCIANKVPVSARGRISTEARAAYDAAHQA